MAAIVRSEVHYPRPSGDPALQTGPINFPAYPATPPLSPEDGGYSSGDYRGGGGAVYADKYYFQAQCQPTDQVFAVVYQVDANTVATADASRPYPAVGVLISRSANNTCTVQRYGACVGFGGLVSGNLYVLGDNGGIVTPPLPDDDIEFVQQIGTALNDTTLFVDPTGQITQRDIQPKPPAGKTAHFFFGHGAPDNAATYTPQDVFIDRVARQAYLRPTPAGRNSQTYAGSGPPSDDGNYTPIALYFRGDGQAFEINDSDTQHTGFSGGADSPQYAPVQQQEAFYDVDSGSEYGRDT